jgi:glycosyltransferase involved in cell wall biosynthesis
MNPTNSAPPTVRVLSVHNRLSATNIPLEAFAHWAQCPETKGRFECAVLSLYGDNAKTHREFANMYDPQATEVWSVNCGWKRPWKLYSLARFLRDWAPDIVHVHHASSAALVSTLAKRFTHARIVTTLHRDFQTLTKPQRWMLSHAISMSDLVLCNSQSTWDSIHAHAGQIDLPESRIIYNGIDLRKIDQVQTALPSRPARHVLRVGAVGRLIPIKGFETLLEAIALLHQQNRAVELVLVGDGPLMPELLRKTRQLGIEGMTTFAGSVPRDEVYRQLHAMDVFVASSYSEGFCNGMVEAMGAGRAVVATDIPVFREILGTDYPLFYTAGSARELAARLQHCSEATVWREQLGERLRLRATNDFSLDACARNHGNVYHVLGTARAKAESSVPKIDSQHRSAA